MKGRSIPYSAEEMAWLEENRDWPISLYHKFFVMFFDRDDVSAVNLHSLRERKGWKTGRTGCFEKGAVPFNKGKRCPEGKGGRHPNARKTQFRKGQEPHNTHHLGHERVDPKDGYVYISVAETNPHTGYPRRYVLKHRHLWEQANGPVQDGWCLKCLDGDKTNTDPSNWEAIPRAMLPRLNGGRNKSKVAFDEAAPELKPAILAIAKLEHKAREVRA